VYTLITAAASAEAYSLKSTLNTDHVVLGDFMELPDILIKSGKVIKLPNPQNPAYTHQMLALCLDRNINTIYALYKTEKQLLLNSKQLFHEYDINVKTTDDKI
jgi:hypothetical protein